MENRGSEIAYRQPHQFARRDTGLFQTSTNHEHEHNIFK
jgi:hypothetical protein